MFYFDEMPSSRQQTMEPPSYTLMYKAKGEQNDYLVAGYAQAATPATVFTPQGTLYRQDVRVDPDGFALYTVTVPYGPKQRNNGSYTWSFDTSGATVKIKCAKEHVESYPTSGNPHKGSIGVKSDGDVEGADIVIPALKINVTFKHPMGIVTLDYAKSLAAATGTINQSAFLDSKFAAGELLFLGASGSDGSEAEAEVGFQFAASQNATGLTIGDIASIAKKGHDLAWVEFKDNTDSGSAVVQPKAVHIERVYDEADWAAIFGWS